jgi:outer membrane protein OmpA-like peptidoglycan-associated protein
VGNKIQFYTINFRGGTAVMLTGSYKVLDKIVRFMKYNPTREVEIGGHVNVPNAQPITESSSDFKLSVNRAKRVYDYLIENGIKESRLLYKGYGNWQMLFPKTLLEEEMVFNRRVEVKVTK